MKLEIWKFKFLIYYMSNLFLENQNVKCNYAVVRLNKKRYIIKI